MSIDEFKETVANHKLTVHLDDGLYRHLALSQPDTNDRHFHVTTWPGYLCISGDMGCFVFSRLPDMFEFFRPGRSQGAIDINPGYWSEKVVSQSTFGGGIREFSNDQFRSAVEDSISDTYDDTPEHELQLVLRAVLDEVGEVESEGEAIGKMMDLDTADIQLPEEIAFGEQDHPNGLNPSDLDFTDFWEATVTRYTDHYIWCCRAIVWAICQYDQWKETQEAA